MALSVRAASRAASCLVLVLSSAAYSQSIPEIGVTRPSVPNAQGGNFNPNCIDASELDVQKSGVETNDLSSWTFSPTDPDADKPGEPKCPVAQPVDIRTGDKFKTEIDFVTHGEFPLYLRRTYNRAWLGPGIFGYRWVSNFDLKLAFTSSGQTVTQVTAWRADGEGISFALNSADGRWEPINKQHPIAWIEQTTAGWTLHSEEHTVETYDQQGRILTQTNEAGVGWTYDYTASNLLNRVTHSSGRTITFNWAASWANTATTLNKVQSVVDSDGNLYSYSYDSSNRFMWLGPSNPVVPSLLSSVQYSGPTGVTRSYSYDTYYDTYAWTTGALLGIAINGTQYTAYAYDSAGRISSNGFTAGIGTTTFSYGTNTATLTNALGAKAVYTFTQTANSTSASPVWKVSTIQRSGPTTSTNATASVIYDTNGYISAVTDWSGNQTKYVYDPKGRLLQRTTGYGTTNQRDHTYVWDDKNRIIQSDSYGTSYAQPVSETLVTYYDAANAAHDRVQSVTVKDTTGNGSPDQLTSHTYNINPATHLIQTMTVTGPAPGAVTTYAYNASGDLVSVVNALNQSHTYANYNGLGEPRAETDTNGMVTAYTYDMRGRLTSSTRGGNQTSFGYDMLGNINLITYPDVSYIARIYDTAGRLITVTNGSNQREQWTYNLLSKPIGHTKSTHDDNADVDPSGCFLIQGDTVLNQARSTMTLPVVPSIPSPPGSGASPLEVSGLPTLQVVDLPADRVPTVAARPPLTSAGVQTFPPRPNPCFIKRRQTDILYFSESWRYDELGRLVTYNGGNGQTVNYQNDRSGNVLVQTDALGHSSAYTYNSHNEAESASDGNGSVTRYAYDRGGFLSSITDPRGLTTNYLNDGFGNLVRQTSPDTGITTCTYDAGGRCTQMTRADGSTTTYSYDVLSRPTSISTSEAATFTWDTCANGVGHLCVASNPGWTLEYKYNQTGTLASQIQTFLASDVPPQTNHPPKSVSWTYDQLDRVQTITYPDGSQAKYSY